MIHLFLARVVELARYVFVSFWFQNIACVVPNCR